MVTKWWRYPTAGKQLATGTRTIAGALGRHG